MKLSYKLTNRPVITTSQLVSTTLKDAMFYLYKEDDTVSFELELKNEDLDISSEIYSTENLKTTFKVKANTTDIMITNVSIEGTPYYYEIKTSDNSVITLSDLTLNTNLNMIERNGRIFTNTYINNYEIKDGTFIYSVATIDSGNYNVKYYNDHILVSVSKSKEDVLYAKTRSDSCITVSVLNDSFVLLPSFYLKTRSKVSKFVEGDVVFFDKKELTKIENNYIKLKDKAVSTKSNGYLNPITNTLYLSDSYINAKDTIVEYTAKRSSHVFEVDSELYLKLVDNNITITNKDDCDLVVRRKVDASKLYITTNQYLNKLLYSFKANSFAMLYNSVLDETKKKMLTKYVDRTTYRSPSEVVYLKINDSTILQEEASQNIVVNIMPKEEVYGYLEEDYVLPAINIVNSLTSKKEIVSISKNLYVGE